MNRVLAFTYLCIIVCCALVALNSADIIHLNAWWLTAPLWGPSVGCILIVTGALIHAPLQEAKA